MASCFFEVLLIRFADCHSYPTRLYHEGPKFDLDDADALARNVKESQLALVGELASRWVLSGQALENRVRKCQTDKFECSESLVSTAHVSPQCEPSGLHNSKCRWGARAAVLCTDAQAA